MRRFTAVAVLLPLVAAAEPGVLSPPRTIAADEMQTTVAGTTFTAPAGWALSSGASVAVLQPPEADSRVAIVDVRASSAAAAVASAWSALRVGTIRPVRVSTPIGASDGWEEGWRVEYEVSPNERAFVVAIARRAGDAWTVAIVDGTQATIEKRGAQALLVVESLRPRGSARESFAGRKAHALDEARVAQILSFVETGMERLQIPGVALALLDGGRVVYEGGVGVAELGKPGRVGADTLFLAASDTKALTTLLLATLVDEGKLRWDEPVVEAYPEFRLGDPETTRRVEVKHLVCACTGLPSQDLEWLLEFAHATPATSMALLSTMQPTSRFGEVFQYSNLLAAAAGYVAGHLVEPRRELGSAYDRAMKSRVFAPLGMARTTFDFSRALAADHASPHGPDVDGRIRVARMDRNYAVVPHRPAGGVWTSAHDLARYVQVELAGGGLPDGRRLVSEENLLARRAPQVQVGDGRTYGMGLELDRRWGVTVVHHDGSLFGYRSDLLFLPDHGVGAVILTNSDTGERLLEPFRRKLLEVLFDGRDEAAAALEAKAARAFGEISNARKLLAVPPDPAAIDRLARRYRSGALGEIVVRRRAGETVFDFGEWSSPVASRKNADGTVSFVTIDPSDYRLELVASERGERRALVLRDAQHEYVFLEVPQRGPGGGRTGLPPNPAARGRSLE